MEGLSAFATLANLLKAYGPFGLLVVIWYFDTKAMRKLNSQYREDTQKILADHKQYMNEQKEYMKKIQRNYESNVKLVRFYEGLAGQLKDVVTLNTQAMTRISDDVNRNQYCPLVRVEKKQVGVKAND